MRLRDLRLPRWVSSITSTIGSVEHQVSLGTIVRVFPAWGTSEFRPQHTTGDIRLVADWKLTPDKLSLNPNIGIARYEDDEGKLFTTGLYALTLSYQPTEHWNPFIDVGSSVI
jgi:hypothetical protein